LDKADFIRTTFKNFISFKKTIFEIGASFKETVLEKRLRFEEVDLSCVSLIDTDLGNIQFIDTTWPKKDGKKHQRYKLIEEKLGEASPSSIEAYYRKLKKRAVEEHNQAEISEWHYCEKEMAREQGGVRWPVLFLYWLSSGYGERPLRAAGVLLGLLVLVTFLMGFCFGLQPVVSGKELLIIDCMPNEEVFHYGLEPAEWESETFKIKSFSDFNGQNLGKIVLNTLQNALFLKDTAFKPVRNVPDGLVQTLFTRILIPIQFALFAFALRNKFRR